MTKLTVYIQYIKSTFFCAKLRRQKIQKIGYHEQKKKNPHVINYLGCGGILIATQISPKFLLLKQIFVGGSHARQFRPNETRW